MIEMLLDTYFWSELAGYGALGVSIIAHQLRRPILALWLLCAGSVLWGVHFMLLGELAFIVMFLNAFRNFCGATLSVERLRAVIVFCVAASFAFIIPQMQGAIDALPLLAVVLISIGAFSKGKPALFRRLWLSGEAVWLLYGLSVGSYALVLASTLIGVSIISSIIRYDLRPARLAK